MGQPCCYKEELDNFTCDSIKGVLEVRKVIEATEGHILTNGEIYGSTIYLAEGENGEDFYEITLEEYNSLMESGIDPQEATAEDYQAALQKLGVKI